MTYVIENGKKNMINSIQQKQEMCTKHEGENYETFFNEGGKPASYRKYGSILIHSMWSKSWMLWDIMLTTSFSKSLQMRHRLFTESGTAEDRERFMMQ